MIHYPKELNIVLSLDCNRSLWLLRKDELIKLLIESGKCDLSILDHRNNFYSNNDIWTYYKSYPDKLIEILQIKPDAFKGYRENIKQIAKENSSLVLSIYGDGVKLEWNELLYKIEGQKSLIRSWQYQPTYDPEGEKDIVYTDILKYLNQKDIFELRSSSKTIYKSLDRYEIAYKDYRTITLTLKPGTLQRFLKESIDKKYDFVWNEEKNSFEYLKNSASILEEGIDLGNELMMEEIVNEANEGVMRQTLEDANMMVPKNQDDLITAFENLTIQTSVSQNLVGQNNQEAEEQDHISDENYSYMNDETEDLVDQNDLYDLAEAFDNTNSHN